MLLYYAVFKNPVTFDIKDPGTYVVVPLEIITNSMDAQDGIFGDFGLLVTLASFDVAKDGNTITAQGLPDLFAVLGGVLAIPNLEFNADLSSDKPSRSPVTLATVPFVLEVTFEKGTWISVIPTPGPASFGGSGLLAFNIRVVLTA